MVSDKTIELIVNTVNERNITYDTLAENTQVSKTTIYRLMAKNTASSFTARKVIDFLGINDQVREIEGQDIESAKPGCEFATELFTELQDIRDFYEEKAASVRAHYEDQLSFLRGQISKMEEANTTERIAQEQNYKRDALYLQADIERLHGRIDKKDDIIRSKDRTIIGMLVALIILLVICCAALMTDSIV